MDSSTIKLIMILFVTIFCTNICHSWHQKSFLAPQTFSPLMEENMHRRHQLNMQTKAQVLPKYSPEETQAQMNFITFSKLLDRNLPNNKNPKYFSKDNSRYYLSQNERDLENNFVPNQPRFDYVIGYKYGEPSLNMESIHSQGDLRKFVVGINKGTLSKSDDKFVTRFLDYVSSTNHNLKGDHTSYNREYYTDLDSEDDYNNQVSEDDYANQDSEDDYNDQDSEDDNNDKESEVDYNDQDSEDDYNDQDSEDDNNDKEREDDYNDQDTEDDYNHQDIEDDYYDLDSQYEYNSNNNNYANLHKAGDDGIIDIEERLPLSAVMDEDLMKYFDNWNSNEDSVQFGFGNDNFAQDKNINLDKLISTKSSNDGVNEDVQDFIGNNVNTNTKYNKITSSFIQAVLATIQIVTKSFFDTTNKRTPSETASINPFLLQKRRGRYSLPSSPKRRRKHKKRRNRSKKLYLHGEDDRSLIFLPLMRKYPFSNVVRLSSGCTGTLLTPYHVLTAAHCVHNGEDFKTNLQMLKIEIPDTMGFRVYYIQKISIPKAWRRSGFLSEVARASYDYAIVRLSIGVPGKTNFVPLSVPKSNVLNQDMTFLGFPTDDEAGLYKSKCHSLYSMAYMDGNLILTRCDSAVGNSGAAVFIDDPRDGKRIVGVLSNTMSVTEMNYITRYSIITALTWNKLYEICTMMAPLGQQYGVCPSFEVISRSSKAPLKNRVIPFFG